MSKHLLILTDTESHIERFSSKLNSRAYVCTFVSDINRAGEIVQNDGVDLLIADYDLIKRHITEIAVAIKSGHKNASLVVYTADYHKEALIDTLSKGADDYCASPFIGAEFDETLYRVLMARAEARLRFGGTNIIDVGELLIDPDEEKIYYLQREIELKGKPFEVLTHLARHRDQIISKEQLLDAIWEEPELVTPNVIEVAINQIRQKMDKPLGINTIETVRRRGYRFCFPNCSGQTIMDK
ncbi:MAG: response regulator transcription factor [Helicobacteraceae bacterium]|jgi:two-component system OmpR family response regulator|nr:response regulator transcription factor [Helicobacteraceae bacterium]